MGRTSENMNDSRVTDKVSRRGCNHEEYKNWIFIRVVIETSAKIKKRLSS